MVLFLRSISGKLLPFTLLLILLSAARAEEMAPVFSLPGEAGPVNLAAYRGNVVYIDFWASWCAPCRKSFPWMNNLQRSYGKQGLTVVAINVDKKQEAARAFLADNPAQFTIAFDPAGRVAEAYRVRTMPSSYLIDRKGTLRSTHLGFFDANKLRIEEDIRQLLAER